MLFMDELNCAPDKLSELAKAYIAWKRPPLRPPLRPNPAFREPDHVCQMRHRGVGNWVHYVVDRKTVARNAELTYWYGPMRYKLRVYLRG